jgi:heme/copper-type cytochrome/quinol oxidase subunit 2
MPFRFADAIYWVAVACCCLAQVAIVRSILISPSAVEGTPPSGARRAGEIAWAVIPGIALALVFLFTWRAMHREPVSSPVAVASARR